MKCSNTHGRESNQSWGLLKCRKKPFILMDVAVLIHVKWIEGQRTNWLGHLERMEEDRMPKKIFTQELEGTRRRGKPRK
jgi:hypothetical protein